jgi:hypothetical protein
MYRTVAAKGVTLHQPWLCSMQCVCVRHRPGGLRGVDRADTHTFQCTANDVQGSPGWGQFEGMVLRGLSVSPYVLEGESCTQDGSKGLGALRVGSGKGQLAKGRCVGEAAPCTGP